MYAFYESILRGGKRPEFSWSFEDNGSIRVVARDNPASVQLWQATNPSARDFRVESIGRAYTATDLSDQGGGVYIGSVQTPEKGWTAYFIELTYPSGGKYPHKFTTAVRVAPDTLPFKDKTPDTE